MTFDVFRLCFLTSFSDVPVLLNLLCLPSQCIYIDAHLMSPRMPFSRAPSSPPALFSFHHTPTEASTVPCASSASRSILISWSQNAKARHGRTSPPQPQCSPLTAEQPQMHRVRGRLAPPRPPSRPRASVKVPTLPWVSCLAAPLYCCRL